MAALNTQKFINPETIKKGLPTTKDAKTIMKMEIALISWMNSATQAADNKRLENYWTVCAMNVWAKPIVKRAVELANTDETYRDLSAIMLQLKIHCRYYVHIPSKQVPKKGGGHHTSKAKFGLADRKRNREFETLLWKVMLECLLVLWSTSGPKTTLGKAFNAWGFDPNIDAKTDRHYKFAFNPKGQLQCPSNLAVPSTMNAEGNKLKNTSRKMVPCSNTVDIKLPKGEFDYRSNFGPKFIDKLTNNSQLSKGHRDRVRLVQDEVTTKLGIKFSTHMSALTYDGCQRNLFPSLASTSGKDSKEALFLRKEFTTKVLNSYVNLLKEAFEHDAKFKIGIKGVQISDLTQKVLDMIKADAKVTS
jgi:hypothetical protein